MLQIMYNMFDECNGYEITAIFCVITDEPDNVNYKDLVDKCFSTGIIKNREAISISKIEMRLVHNGDSPEFNVIRFDDFDVYIKSITMESVDISEYIGPLHKVGEPAKESKD